MIGIFAGAMALAPPLLAAITVTLTLMVADMVAAKVQDRVPHQCWVTFAGNERILVPHGLIPRLPRCLRCMITGRVDDENVHAYPAKPAGPIPYYSASSFALLVNAERFPDAVRRMGMEAVDDLAHAIAHVGCSEEVENLVRARYRRATPKRPEDDVDCRYDWTTRASFRSMESFLASGGEDCGEDWVLASMEILEDNTDVYFLRRPKRAENSKQ